MANGLAEIANYTAKAEGMFLTNAIDCNGARGLLMAPGSAGDWY